MSNIEYFIVEGGHDGDPDPEKTGRIRVRQMGKHGQNVKTEHLPLNQTLKSDASEFHRPPSPGTILAGYVPKGAEHTGYSHLLGSFATKQESGASVPGNTTLPFLDKAQNIELKIKLPPNIKAILEKNRTGLEKFKKEIEEKGEQFKQATLRGLPSDGAIFALSGIRNTPFKNISTAIDKAASQMSSSKLAGLSGLVSSLDLNSLISQLISQLDLPDTMVQTLESFVKTASGDINSVSPPGGASLGNLINQEKFLIKALDLMKDVKTTGELLRVIQTLQHPDTLADTLSDISNISINSDSIFGAIKQEINSAGEIVEIANDFIDNIKNALSNLLNAIPSAGIDAESFFTTEGTPIQDLIQRMKDTAKATELKEAVEKVSSSLNSRKQKQRTNNNSTGKGATQDIIFKAKQLIARDGRIVPFHPTTKNGVSGTATSMGTPGTDPSPVASSNVAAEALIAAIAAFDKANSAFDTANSAVGSSSGQAGNTANSSLLTAQSAFAVANVANDIAIAAFNKANTEGLRLTSAYSTINSESIRLTSAFNKSNSAESIAIAAFAKANTYVTSDASNTLNTAIGAFAKANAEETRLTSAYSTINSETTRLTSAFAAANGALSTAQGAFATANAKMLVDFSNASNTAPNAVIPHRLKATVLGIPVTDWNIALENGWYAGYNANNAPFANTSNIWVFGSSVAYSTSWVKQTVSVMWSGDFGVPQTSAANTGSYQRFCFNGTWSSWYPVLVSKDEILTQTWANNAGERTRLTSAYATVNSESTRLTSAFAFANGTWSDSGVYSPTVTCSSGKINSYTANGYFKRIDKETGHVAVSVVISNKGNAAGSMTITMPFTNADTFPSHLTGRSTGTGFLLQGIIFAGTNALVILNYDNSTVFSGNNTLSLSGLIKTQPVA